MSVTTLVLTPLVAALSALLGAWGGARTALERFRSERAFDSRLDWCEKVHAAMRESLNALWRAIGSEETHIDPKTAWLAFQATLVELAHASVEAELYASNESLAAIRRLQEDQHEMFRSLDTPTDGGAISLNKAGEAFSSQLRWAMMLIATDVRKHLGLERLDVKLIDAAQIPERRRLPGK